MRRDAKHDDPPRFPIHTSPTSTLHPPSSLDICVHSPTHLIKRPELAILPGLFIKPQAQRGKMEPDLNQNWRKWFPGNVSFTLSRYINVCRRYLSCCFGSVVHICLLKQMLQLRREEALSCCSEVCLNCFNLIGGPTSPRSCDLVHAEYKTSVWSSWWTTVRASASTCQALPFNHTPPPHTTTPHSQLILTWHRIWNGLFVLLICCV